MGIVAEGPARQASTTCPGPAHAEASQASCKVLLNVVAVGPRTTRSQSSIRVAKVLLLQRPSCSRAPSAPIGHVGRVHADTSRGERPRTGAALAWRQLAKRSPPHDGAVVGQGRRGKRPMLVSKPTTLPARGPRILLLMLAWSKESAKKLFCNRPGG